MKTKAIIFSSYEAKQAFRLGSAIEVIKFILTSRHYKGGQKIEQLRNEYNIVIKFHYYHGGGNIKNRHAIVEALVCNFELPYINEHFHIERNVEANGVRFDGLIKL